MIFSNYSLVKYLQKGKPRSSMDTVNRASLRKKNAERREAHKAMER